LVKNAINIINLNYNRIPEKFFIMTKTKIMIVDDEKDIRILLKNILKDEGYEVITANDGDGCLKKLEKDVSIILLDIMMPGTPVADIVDKIKKKRELLSLKIIYVTAVSISKGQRNDLLNDEIVEGFIEKPFENKKIVSMVERTLKKMEVSKCQK
jgi:CheY-like chemotaxis protein